MCVQVSQLFRKIMMQVSYVIFHGWEAQVGRRRRHRVAAILSARCSSGAQPAERGRVENKS